MEMEMNGNKNPSPHTSILLTHAVNVSKFKQWRNSAGSVTFKNIQQMISLI